MWEYVEPMTSDEIYHHGIKNQKWGQRLYQNLDGSLTPLGRLRYGNKSNYNRVQAAKASIKKKKIQARTEAEVAKYRKKAQETYDKELEKRSAKETLGDASNKITDLTMKGASNKEIEQEVRKSMSMIKEQDSKKVDSDKKRSSKKSDAKKEEAEREAARKAEIANMSDKDLQAKINRMKLEQDYEKVYKEMNPKTISRGKKFVDKLLDDSLNAVAKGVGDAIGAQAKTYVNKTLGLAIKKSLEEEVHEEHQNQNQNQGDGNKKKKNKNQNSND